MQLALDKFGRMVLPKSIRDDLGLGQGDIFDVEEKAGTILLRPLREQNVIMQKDGVLVFTGTPTGDLRKATTEHRRHRIGRMSAWKKRS